jgi:hypothetical protein
MPTTTATRRTRASRPVTAKDGAEASGVIAANARSRKAAEAQASEPSKSDAVLPAPVATTPVRRTGRGRVLPPSKTGNPTTDKANAEVFEKVAAGRTPDEKAIAANDASEENHWLAEIARAGARLLGSKETTSTPGLSHARIGPHDVVRMDRVAHQFLLMPSGQFEVHKMGCRDVARQVKNSQYDKAMSAKWASEEEAIRDLWADQINESTGPDSTVSQLNDGAYIQTVDFQPCCTLMPLGGNYGAKADARATAAIADPAPVKARTRTVANGKGATTATRTAKPKGKPTPAGKPTPKLPKGKVSTGAKAESEAQAARRTAKRTLARSVLLSAEEMLTKLTVAELAALGMSREEAKACVSQWVHHLPVRDSSEATPWWPLTMPKPDRSDWR